MPTIDNQAALRAERVARLKSLKRGDMITADLAMSRVTMKSAGRLVDCTPERPAAAIEAERKAAADREWLDRCRRLYT